MMVAFSIRSMHQNDGGIVSMARAAILGLICLLAAQAANALEIERDFDAMVRPDEMQNWLKILSAEPNHVGSPHDRTNAEFILSLYRQFGWDAHIETFDVLYPTPVSETVELSGSNPFKATLQEPPISGDTSAQAREPALPAYFAFQGDGDVTAPLIYVNYGMERDYRTLERLGVSVAGKIVIARYGAGWRGLKPLLAQMHGAVGCLVYSDPAEDGYSTDSPYPEGGARPANGLQRGSVMDMPLYPGDPRDPGTGVKWTRETSPAILKIPALPISYGDAEVLLRDLSGRVAPESWRGRLPITYRVGPSRNEVHLAVKSEWSTKTIRDVIAVIKGTSAPEQWILRGNHFDGWVFGASDPLSGQVTLLEEAKIIGQLVKRGFRPARTIVYASWDAEEPGLIGSTEWAQAHAAELKAKALLYINSDGNRRGIFQAGGSQDLTAFVNAVANGVVDPETQTTIGQRRRAWIRVQAFDPQSADPEAIARLRNDAAAAADPKRNFPINALGSGSDFSAFLDHLGIPSVNLEFGGEGEFAGAYHSRYDTFEHHMRFADPGLVYGAALTKAIGHAVLEAASSDLPLQHPSDFAEALGEDVKELKKLADDRRSAAELQRGLIADDAFRLARDPAQTYGDPTPLQSVPRIDFAALDDAVDRLTRSAKTYEDRFAATADGLSAERRARLMGVMGTIEQTLTPENGLPGRPWYRNLVYAPGRMTGYGAKTLPGIREAIEDQRWSDAASYLRLTAEALNAYRARLDEASALLGG